MPRRHHVLKSPGRPPLSSKRDLYIRLMRQGMSNTDACLAVGVHRRTGYRWSRGRTVRTRDGRDRVYDAITSPPVPISARFLSEEERLLIADGLMLGQSIRSLARELDRSPSTIQPRNPTQSESWHWSLSPPSSAAMCRRSSTSSETEETGPELRSEGVRPGSSGGTLESGADRQILAKAIPRSCGDARGP